MSAVGTPVRLAGKGLITGQPVAVTVEQAPAGHGIVFVPEGGAPIPARLASVVNTDRGVTLANGEGWTLSIVEHFLAACSLAGLDDLRVTVSGAPELPILDGSARPWLDAFQAAWSLRRPEPAIPLPHAVVHRHSADIAVYALPHSHPVLSYAVNFKHPELAARWARWDSRMDDWHTLAGAGTYGYLAELPALQARGLAMGVDADNTLGLLAEGGYTRPLRMIDEPIHHKMLDLLGDLTLAGFNPLTLKAHIVAVHAGHDSHTAFARRLLAALG